MEILVDTIAFPRPGTVVSSALYKSYPAAKALPLVGARPFGERSWTWRGGGVSDVACEAAGGREFCSVAISGDLKSSTSWCC